MRKVHIALLMMVKNEHKRIHVTLNSVKGFVDSLVIFDTGSTDDTINILKEFSAQNKIPLRLKEGEFVNFSTSRNISLEFADTFKDIDYILLLDCNDELRGGAELRKFADMEMSIEKSSAYLISQEWWSGVYDKYFNIRFAKVRRGWRYRGSVHEWLKNTLTDEGEKGDLKRLPDSIVLFQDRTQDDDKTGKRFERDKSLLLVDYKKNKKDPRTLFYLAQTCSCLNQKDEALYYYKLRTKLEGFQEEKFHAYLRCGDMSKDIGQAWEHVMSWYIKALEHSKRAEPLVKISNYYKDKKDWLMSFTFSDFACRLTYPDHCILFVDKRVYEWERWHLLGIVGYYCDRFEEGKAACCSAIAAGHAKEVEQKNLQFYYDKEKEIRKNSQPLLTKKQFMDMKLKEIEKTYPNLTKKQTYNRANKEWKLLR